MWTLYHPTNFPMSAAICAPQQILRHVDLDIQQETKQLGRLLVVYFTAGRVATLEDAALMMELWCDGVFVGSGVFKSGDPVRRGRAIVQAVHYSDPKND
ncbi:hypothetical protein RJ640_006743 [Escallonia rubra]|uniref:pyridoxal 5'-phosphate synthase (glutamine hydrolyzing) n=1 Tax=Escallonia rubra TaxID=112253 RepID=A0AA88RAW7_9ASTE|nr:hypothetical protein RJ640_006743 [Escallonia rubra]